MEENRKLYFNGKELHTISFCTYILDTFYHIFGSLDWDTHWHAILCVLIFLYAVLKSEKNRPFTIYIYACLIVCLVILPIDRNKLYPPLYENLILIAGFSASPFINAFDYISGGSMILFKTLLIITLAIMSVKMMKNRNRRKKSTYNSNADKGESL